MLWPNPQQVQIRWLAVEGGEGDRLDRHFEAGLRMVVDRNIGPKNRLVVIGDKPALHLRLIDTEAGTVWVLEDEVPIQGLFDAIADVPNQAQGWLTEHGQ